jgi:HAD superfamily phosphatase
VAGDYVETRENAGVVMVRTEAVPLVTTIDAIIFDCDGVLIDVRDSYTTAIHASVAYVLRALFGVDFPATPSLLELIHTFKKSGGFNNEWDIVYALLLALFTQLPPRLQRQWVATRQQFADKPPAERFSLAKRMFQHQLLPHERAALLDLAPAFTLARQADSTGIASIERAFTSDPASQDVFAAAHQFLAYPGPVGESLLTTIFEELFCGSALFKRQYGISPQFYWGRGLIAQEKPIVSPTILADLAARLGHTNFGIATGRPYSLTQHTLRGLLDCFRRPASVFIEDVLAAERRERATGSDIALTKPHPFSLLQSAEGLNPFTRAAYVGDSAEDVIMVKTACRTDNRFVSVGVYSTSSFQDDLIATFMALETDVILPSIHELAGVLENVERMKR